MMITLRIGICRWMKCDNQGARPLRSEQLKKSKPTNIDWASRRRAFGAGIGFSSSISVTRLSWKRPATLEFGFSDWDYERADAPGAAAPKVLAEDIIKALRPGPVVVDIAINKGGCFETSNLTGLDDPIYTKNGVAHYCVTNMPGAVDLRAIHRHCAVYVTVGR